MTCTGSYAQKDTHLAKLTQGLVRIRSKKASSGILNKTVMEWSATECPKITLMDDLGKDKENEFLGNGSNKFKINQVVTYVHGRQNIQLTSKGEYFTSTEKDVHYSVIEKGHTASYTLTGHIGDQEFVVVSYNSKTKFTVKVNGDNAVVAGDGICAILLSNVKKTDTITITIANEGTSDESFVILNHNPQK